MSNTVRAAAAIALAAACVQVRGAECMGRWLPQGPGVNVFDDDLSSMIEFGGRLYACGTSTVIASWDGAAWRDTTRPVTQFPRAFAEFGGKLYFGGTKSGNTTVGSVLNEQTWSPTWQDQPSTSVGPTIRAMSIFQGVLAVGGHLPPPSASSRNAVWRWDGTQWGTLGPSNAFTGDISRSIVYQGELYVGGVNLNLAGNFSAGAILRYDGTSWKKVGEFGIRPILSDFAMLVYQGKLMIGCREIHSVGGLQYGPLAMWDGTTVTKVLNPDAAINSIAAMTEYNGDLIIGGDFTNAFGVGANCIVRWNGTSFAPLGVGISGTTTSGRIVECLSVYHDELLAGGDIEMAGGEPSPWFARWTDNPTAWVAVGPASQTVNKGLTLNLTAAAASGYDSVTYKWQRNGVDITNGPGGASPGGGTVSGAFGILASPSDGSPVTLTIGNVQGVDGGSYAIFFDNGCSPATSAPATIVVNTCPCDLNGDGIVEVADFSIFVVAYNILDCADPAMPASCPADFNGDAVVDDADFVIFVQSYNELLCP